MLVHSAGEHNSNSPRSTWNDLRESFRLGWRALRLIWTGSPRLLLLLVVLLLLQAVLAPVELHLFRALIDRAAIDARLGGTSDALAMRLSLADWIGLTALCVVGAQLLGPIIQTCRAMISDRLTAQLGEALIRAANRWQGLSRFEDPDFADDLTRARTSVPRIGLDIVVHGSSALAAVLTAVGLIAVCAQLSPLVPVLLLLCAIPSLFLQFSASAATTGLLFSQTPAARLLGYCRDTVLSPGPAKDVRLYNLVSYFRARYVACFTQTFNETDRLRFRMIGGLTVTGVLATAGPVGVYLLVVWLVGRGQRTLGDLTLYGGAAIVLQSRLGDIATALQVLPGAFGTLPSLLRVLNAPPDLPQSVSPLPAPRPILQGFAFEHVTFCYPGQSHLVLDDLSFQLAPGESVALVGQNGAGKTTIVKLLLRLYDPTVGRILLDGVDLRHYDLVDLRQEMGAVFQDFVRYELTVAENIGLGRFETLNEQSLLNSAIASVRAESLIASLPEGLETQVGQRFSGRDLSGGEWQKLALARAFLRQSQVLILDEPTAALDVQTEHEIYTHFQELTRGRMTVLISHRFSTVRMADRILFLAQGRVQETGTHAELLAQHGTYAELYALQAAQYATTSTDPGVT